MRIGYLGPEGTFSQAAVLTAPAADDAELVPLTTNFEVVVAVQEGLVDCAAVAIENSQEGSVTAVLDALAFETNSVAIVGEVVLPIEQCLIASNPIELQEIEVVVSHPVATGQCARFIRDRLPGVQIQTATSTADAVRLVSERIRYTWAAIGPRLAAELYGCSILRAGIEDMPGNETRFVWLAPFGSAAGAPGVVDPRGPWKTSMVFWGSGTETPGWLVRCLDELSSRDVNMTRIESRPRRQGLGRYMFFVDIEGRDSEPHVAEGLAALRRDVDTLRILGSFPAA